MRVIVTRVQPQADSWAKQLTGRFDAVALPLIVVAPARDAKPVRDAGQRWPDYAAAMFVSSHAVHFFFEQNKALALDLKAQSASLTRAWGTGPGTRAALLRQGMSPALVDTPSADAGQFDSEALWQAVCQQIQPGARVLIVRGDTLAPKPDKPETMNPVLLPPPLGEGRGEGSGLLADGIRSKASPHPNLPPKGEGAIHPQHLNSSHDLQRLDLFVTSAGGANDAQDNAGVGRDWLAQQLRQAGATVDFVVAYQRGAPHWSATERALAQAAASDGSVWLFSSAEALQHLHGLLPGQDWSGARAVATHERIAQVARALGFGVVLQTRPTLADVVASLESLA